MSKMKRHIPSEHNPDKMCRLCLVEDPVEEMIDIFESSEVSLTVKIMACAGLEVCLFYFACAISKYLRVKRKFSKYNNIYIGYKD